MKNLILYIVFFVIVNVLMFIAVWKETSPEYWYSGMHDSKCETLDGNKECHCYERLVAADKNNNHK